MSAEFWKEFKRSEFSDYALVDDAPTKTGFGAFSKSQITRASPTPSGNPAESQTLAIVFWILLGLLLLLIVASVIKIVVKYNRKEVKQDMEDGLIPSLGRHSSIKRDSKDFDESQD